MTRGAAVVLALGALASGRAVAQRSDPPQAIAEVPFPLAVAPDGRRVAVVGPEANLAVLDVAAGRTRTLTSKPDWPELVLDAAFSPDGTRLAYAWHNERDFDDLRIIGADGAGQRILFRDSAIRSISVKDWSPDGRHVLAVLLGYDSTTRIALVPAAGGTPRILREVDTTLHGPPGRMLFSPDGRSIAYDAGAKSPPWPHDLYLMAVDGGDPARIVRHGSDDRLIGWAPDGAAIAFASDRSGTVDLWRLPLSGGTPELLRRDVGRMTPLGLGPDGSYYFAASSCACQLQVVRLDPRTGRLDEGAETIGPALRWSGVHWSPDGRYLAYVAPEPGVQLAGGRSRGSWAIVVRSVESGEERRIHADLSAVHQLRPRWSPDGRFLLLEGWDVRAYPAEVAYAVAVETGEVAPLFRSESLWGWMFDWTTWSAGGDAVHYTDQIGDSSGVGSWDRASGRHRILSRHRAPPWEHGLAESPDGRHLAFGLSDGSRRTMSLAVWSLERNQQRILVEVTMPEVISRPAWLPDGRHVLYFGPDGLWRVSLDGGAPEHLGRAPGANRAGISIHPAGDRIAFVTEQGYRSEVMVIRGLLPPP